MSVRSAHARSGNPRTGNGLAGLAVPATVCETLENVSPEAEDAQVPGGGSDKDETDPFRDLFVGTMDNPNESASEHKSDSDALVSPSDDEPLISHTTRLTNTKNTKPCLRPGIKVASLNMRGRLKGNKDKLKMVIDWLRLNKIAILAVQETHLMEDSIRELNLKYRNLKFFGSGLSTSSSGILFILADRAGEPQNTYFTELIKGRSGLLSLEYGTQTINIINIYMPNNKLHQKETLIELRQKMDNIQDINNKELLIIGDWNFVEDSIDRSPQHNDDHNVISEMTKLKTSFNLLDGWRESNPDAWRFTWEGSSGCDRRKIFSRIDRIYTARNTWEPSNEYEILSCDCWVLDFVSMIF